MGRALIAVGLIWVLLAGWVAVQNIARRMARRHPELGSYREAGGGCCGGCAGDACDRKVRDENHSRGH